MKLFFALVSLVLVGSLVFFHKPLWDFWYKQRHAGLLNYDYGIISVEDLKFADRDSFPPSPRHGGYPYWQCFNSRELKVDCDYSEPRDEQGSILSIEIESKTEIHHYLINHGISGEVCDEFLARIKFVLEGRSHFCINGSQGALDRISDKKEYSWFYYQLKTKTGYAIYFSLPGMPGT